MNCFFKYTSSDCLKGGRTDLMVFFSMILFFGIASDWFSSNGYFHFGKLPGLFMLWISLLCKLQLSKLTQC
jgi:hypothetical protein